ncbi:MAG: magnesium transporter [Nitrospirae bacterium]|nr:magnesium transporter [Nitrospirota bacterium]
MPLFGELFLSEILKKPILDPKGEELGRVKDISIVKGEPLPKVDSIILQRKALLFRIPWQDLDLFNKRIISARLYADSLVPYVFNEEDLLAVRDLLDKQIVDVNGVKVVRANDIRLEGHNSDAMLTAVDVGMRGILRRLGFEKGGEDFLKLFRATLSYNLISWNYIQPLHPKLTAIGLTVPRQMVSEMHPADLAELISQVSHDEGATFIENLDSETAAETISELEPEAQSAMIKEMLPEKASEIIEEMTPDDAADVLHDLPPEKVRDIMGKLDEETRGDIQELLGHEEDTAGGIMTTEFITYPEELLISEVIERFKSDAPEIETVYYIYAVKPDEKLSGVISLREILLAEPSLRLSDAMETKLKTVSPETDEMEVARIISKYNLVALPVVNTEGIIQGVVTIDDIVDTILPRRKRGKV